MTELGYFLNVVSYLRGKLVALWYRLPIGTRSVLFGAHAFYLHPFYVALAWWNLNGFPFDPRLWAAFFLHDLGYWGKPNIDGAEGEKHVELGARIMAVLFDGCSTGFDCPFTATERDSKSNLYWHDFTLYHSRHYAKQHGAAPSRLCFADKLAFAYQHKGLYLFMTGVTGELQEYLANAVNGSGKVSGESPSKWFDDLKAYMVNWVADHKDGAEDTVTVLKTHSK